MSRAAPTASSRGGSGHEGLASPAGRRDVASPTALDTGPLSDRGSVQERTPPAGVSPLGQQRLGRAGGDPRAHGDQTSSTAPWARRTPLNAGRSGRDSTEPCGGAGHGPEAATWLGQPPDHHDLPLR